MGQAMAGDGGGFGRIEQAIYLVGGLVVALTGLSSFASTGLGVYAFFAQSHTSSASTPMEVNWTVGFLVATIYLLAGLFLLYLRSQVGGRATQPV
jgi:hypothetical protein